MTKYRIELEEDYLVVLSDLLYRMSEADVLDDFVEDKAELKAIWVLEWLLEKITPCILSWDYTKVLREARDRYRNEE